MAVKPPVNPNSPDANIQEVWSSVVWPFRALALVFLWVTVAWWRFALAVVTVALVLTAMYGKG